MKTFGKLNNILGWGVFAIASFVYLSTIEPTASWWDCGEYIATTYKLQVGHPPGAPLFQLIGRFFSLFAFGDVTKVAMMINAMSALSSAFTILFLFWSITMLGLKFNEGKEMTTGRMYAILGSGLVGALAYTFTDSFWFSAVEGEVYAMSSFFTAIVFWAILKWDRVSDQPHATRWIILIAFLMGLSVGVHLLNLLTIPAMALIFYFRKFKPTTKGTIVTLVLSFLILAFVMFMIIPYTVALAGKYEIAFVNSLHLPFNSGTFFYFAVLFGALIWGILFTYHSRHTTLEYIIGGVLLLLLSIFSWSTFIMLLLVVGAYYYYKTSDKFDRVQVRTVANTTLISLVFLLIGYSSFFVLVIRANTNTPINENEPSDAVGLLSYLNRDQYGSWPLLYGQYYNAPLNPEDPYNDGTPIYVKDVKQGRYVITDDRKNSIPDNYDSRFCTIFPRMWSPGDGNKNVQAYKSWGGQGVPVQVTNSEGKTETINRPTFFENIKFFLTYQIGHMYMRYFFWNFAGRQNDIESEGSIKEGNWISGIPFLDNMRLGDQSNLPDSMSNPAKNKFYMLPLLLGLIGMFYQLRKHTDGFLVVLMLFLMTGIAIVVYLNIAPNQPRERDYAFAGSFYAFAIWIGLGVMALWDWVKKYNEKYSPIILTAVCLLLVPGIMAKEGWNDHDRSHKYAMRDFAVNYLESCAPNAIIVTNGDNDTFPLWYAQEVEGIRTDVRVVNFMLSSGDWYVHQLMRKVYNSEPLPFIFSYEQYNKGVNENCIFSNQLDERVELKDLIHFMSTKDAQATLEDNKTITVFPTKKVKITVDSANLVKNGIVPANLADKIVKTVEWDIQTNVLYKNDLMLLDFLASNDFKRPIYFSSPYIVSKSVDVSKYIYQEGFVYRFMPVKQDDSSYVEGLGSVNAEASYDIFMNKCKWGNLNDPKVYVDRQSYYNVGFPKQNLSRLAQALISKGETEKAVRVCDYVQQNFPDNKVHYDTRMLGFLQVYYKANAIDKANKLASRLLDIYEQNADYALSLEPKFKGYYEQDLNEAFGVMGAIKQIAEQSNQTAIVQRIDKFFQSRVGKMN